MEGDEHGVLGHGLGQVATAGFDAGVLSLQACQHLGIGVGHDDAAREGARVLPTSEEDCGDPSAADEADCLLGHE